MMFVIMFTIFSSTGASALVSEKVFSDFGECWTQKVPYYPTISKPMNRGQRMTLEQIDPVFKVGTCALSSEVVEVIDGKPTLVTGWVYLPGHFELAKVGESYYMQQCSNAITWIGPPEDWKPKPATVVATKQDATEEGEILLTTTNQAQPQPMQLAAVGNGYAPATGGVVTQSSSGVNGWAVAGAVLAGGAIYHLASRDRGDEVTNNITNVTNTTTNTGQCAGANVVTTGDGNIVCSNVTTSPPIVCTITGQTVVNGVCQCPQGQTVVNGSCQVPVQYCPDGSVRPANGQCPLVCTGGKIPVNGVCQCPIGQEEFAGVCRIPLPQCQNGQIPINGICQCPVGQQLVNGFCQQVPRCRVDQILVNNVCQCPIGQAEIGGYCQQPLVCTGGKIPINGICQCPVGQEEFAGVCRIPLPPGGGTSGTCPAGQVMFAGVCRDPLPGG